VKAALEPLARKRMLELGHCSTRDDPELMRIARRLIDVAEVDSSDKIIKRQLIAPVLRKLRAK
jgi:hypothetical protein